jgi:hypothetical protein
MKTTGNGAVHGRAFSRAAAALLALFTLGSLAAAAPALAGDPGVRLGYYHGADADDAVPVIGVFGRFDIPGPLNLEVSADYRQETMNGGDLKATVVPLRASVVLNFLPVVSPYLLAGAGVDLVGLSFHNEFSATANDTAAVLEVHAGGGVELSLGPLSLIGDLRYCRVGAVSSDAVQAALGHDYDPSGWYASISAGISF